MLPNSREPKRIVIIAGPNGAGKTTFATTFCRVKRTAQPSSMPI
jgi:ABC-type Mn2+/Zn2+ transport system ATPase subunit